MSFELPDLATVPAAQLLDELAARIPRVAPQWTEQNASDPGITLLEMLVWIVEATAFQANCIPFEAYLCKVRFILGLASGAETTRPYAVPASQKLDPHYEQLQERLQAAERDGSRDFATLREAVFDFRSKPYLASTQSDIEALAKEANDYTARTRPDCLLRVLEAYAEYVDGMVVLNLLVGDATRPFLEYDSKPTQTPLFSTALRSLSPEIEAGDGAIGDVAQVVEDVRCYVSPRSLLGNPISIRGVPCRFICVLCTVRCVSRACPSGVAERIAQAIIDWMQPYSPEARARPPGYGTIPTAASLQSVLAGVEGIYAVETLTIEHMPTCRNVLDTEVDSGTGSGDGPFLPWHFKGHPLGVGGVTILRSVKVTAKVSSS